MPFVFIFVGLFFLVSGVRGTSDDLLTLVKGDFTGNNNFVYWFLSIAVIGGLGYVEDLRAFSRSLLILVLLVLFLKESNTAGNGGGFIAEFQKAIAEITGSKTNV